MKVITTILDVRVAKFSVIVLIEEAILVRAVQQLDGSGWPFQVWIVASILAFRERNFLLLTTYEFTEFKAVVFI